MRFYEKNEIIANEMDESLEVLFVDKGKYNVGFEINKLKFLKRKFGPSTIIGGFEICYQKKHMFLYEADT